MAIRNLILPVRLQNVTHPLHSPMAIMKSLVARKKPKKTQIIIITLEHKCIRHQAESSRPNSVTMLEVEVKEDSEEIVGAIEVEIDNAAVVVVNLAAVAVEVAVVGSSARIRKVCKRTHSILVHRC